MTREVLADRVRSISYIAVMPPTERERLAAEVTALVARRAEPFALPYVCRVQWCQPALSLLDVVGGPAARPAVAPDPGPVGGARLRGDGAADAGGRVAARWRPFLDRFPTPAALAAAPVAEVIRWWTGLGYNRRALSLHRCAQAVVAEHGGRLPADLDALLALPGIGPYTARAVLAFAFEHDHGVVDTNAARVLARWEGRRLRAREAQAAADRADPRRRRVGVEPGHARPRRVGVHAADCRGARSARSQARCAWASAGWPAPDPADGSAGVSGGQSRFEGSDRQGRGRLVEALRHGAVTGDALPAVMGWPDDADRARRIAATLVADGLATTDGRTLPARLGADEVDDEPVDLRGLLDVEEVAGAVDDLHARARRT